MAIEEAEVIALIKALGGSGGGSAPSQYLMKSEKDTTTNTIKLYNKNGVVENEFPYGGAGTIIATDETIRTSDDKLDVPKLSIEQAKQLYDAKIAGQVAGIYYNYYQDKIYPVTMVHHMYEITEVRIYFNEDYDVSYKIWEEEGEEIQFFANSIYKKSTPVKYHGGELEDIVVDGVTVPNLKVDTLTDICNDIRNQYQFVHYIKYHDDGYKTTPLVANKWISHSGWQEFFISIIVENRYLVNYKGTTGSSGGMVIDVHDLFGGGGSYDVIELATEEGTMSDSDYSTLRANDFNKVKIIDEDSQYYNRVYSYAGQIVESDTGDKADVYSCQSLTNSGLAQSSALVIWQESKEYWIFSPSGEGMAIEESFDFEEIDGALVPTLTKEQVINLTNASMDGKNAIIVFWFEALEYIKVINFFEASRASGIEIYFYGNMIEYIARDAQDEVDIFITPMVKANVNISGTSGEFDDEEYAKVIGNNCEITLYDYEFMALEKIKWTDDDKYIYSKSYLDADGNLQAFSVIVNPDKTWELHTKTI